MNEAFAKRFIDLLLKFKEFMRWHLIGVLSNRGGSRLQVDDEFDSSNRGYSWKFFLKDIGKFANDWDTLDTLKRRNVQSIQSIYLSFGILDNVGGVVHYLARGVKESDDFATTIERGIVSL